MKSLTKDHKSSNQFFFDLSPQTAGRIGTTNEEATTPGEEDTQARLDGVPTNTNPSGTSEVNAYRQFEKYDYNSETYVGKSSHARA